MRFFFIHRINTAGCGTIIAFFIFAAIIVAAITTAFSNILNIIVLVLGIILIVSFPAIIDAIKNRKVNKEQEQEKDIFEVK
jgi:predicted membrane protein